MSREIKEPIQVNPEHYDNSIYDNKHRFISYWNQINEIIDLSPSSVLEIGKGNGFVSNYLKERGFKVTTLDFDERLNPDVVSSVTNIALDNNQFDVVSCCEVLEHIPFESFTKALNEINRVTKKYAVISLPDAGRYYAFFFHIPYFKKITKLIPLPSVFLPVHVFKGEHHWEINKKGYPLKKILEIVENNGFKIKKHYPLFEFSFHHFFILEKTI